MKRPNYHFTPKKGWMNDPNGLVFYNGIYHLFYQANPNSFNGWANPLSWGHSISTDLYNWEYKPIAILADDKRSIYSGSAIVDYKNVLGLKQNNIDPIVLFWTDIDLENSYSRGIKITYSLDGGETFTEYKTVLEFPFSEKKWDRDPKVFYHKESDKYIMVIYGEATAKSGKAFVFFSSDNLLNWKYESEFDLLYECPDLFSLEVDNETKWVISDASGSYIVGNFDGRKFTPCQEKITDQSNYINYAAQTWNNTDKVFEIFWFRQEVHKNADFSQQMSLPLELGLRNNNGTYELTRKPVSMKKDFYYKGNDFSEIDLSELDSCLIEIENHSDLVLHTYAGNIFITNEYIEFKGIKSYDIAEGVHAEFKGQKAYFTKYNDKIQIYIDVNSLEIFGDEGVIYMNYEIDKNPEKIKSKGKADFTIYKISKLNKL